MAWWFGPCAVAVMLAASSPVAAQVSPEEHARHHPDQAAGQPGTIPPAGPMVGMMGGMGGMMGGMGGMMGGMGGLPAKELFPSLMEGGAVTPERRAEIEQLALERTSAGFAMFNEGMSRYENGANSGDQAAMREGIDRMKQGLDLLESGEAARAALADPAQLRATALRWFKKEMDIDRPAVPSEEAHGILGLSWFHFFTMLLLGGFAAVMIWMYFHKMRRACALLQNLTNAAGGSPESVHAGVPLAGKPPAPTSPIPLPTTPTAGA